MKTVIYQPNIHQTAAMLNKEEFIKFILADPKGRSAPSSKAAGGKAKAESDALGGYGFDDNISTPPAPSTAETTFARQLLEASGFGIAQYLATSEVILGGDPAAQHLPKQVYYWPKTKERPYQTILFELTQPSGELLKQALFRSLSGVLEDALSRLAQDTLKGFEIGGERRRADVKQGRQDETLCVVSIRDERNKENGAAHLVCFGTVAKGEGSLETFHIREEARFWEPQLAQDHLERLYDRHFKKLATDKWQDAFISGDERKLARKLMDVCQGVRANESKIQEAVIDLLEQIALSYGLKKKPGAERRLEATDLPQDHDIGIHDGAMAGGRKNPFRGMTLRDEKNRLLGYIIYCLDTKKDAEVLRAHLEANNRFHNVLVVYPNGESTGLELWQGKRPLKGKLTKRGATFEGEGQVVNLLSRFFVVSKALVTNPAELAAELAYRARYLRGFALRELEKPELLRDKDLSILYNSFHDIFLRNDDHDESKKHDEFADSYAQTLTYGLLSARWISKDELASKGERFTLDNATGLLERTSPFFKELFTQVISQSHDASRDWLLQDITDLLDRIDIDAVFAVVQDDILLGHDLVMHFYEPFLAAYDAAIKRQRGVFYTPHPVVSYIVRSVHELLQTEFGLEDGLADITPWGEMIKKHPSMKLPPLTAEPGDKRTISPDEPFVLILDIATGTATFLVEVIDVIYRTLVEKWKRQGFTEAKINTAWNEYVPKHLLPRLYGYELMMAPYAIAHLKIGLKLAETGYKFASKERARVYLTNALEPPHDLSGRLAFDAPALAHEAAAVNKIKRNMRFTVVIGNPPYSNFGQLNKNPFILGLLEDYKRGLDEKKINLDDDFIKFVRFSHYVLEMSNVGVIGMITNNTFLDGSTRRVMRERLCATFDSIFEIDLHGNSIEREVSPDGSLDVNVFDIQQGVAISFFACTPKMNELPRLANFVRIYDSYGLREKKYAWLSNNSICSTSFISIDIVPPHFRFQQQDQNVAAEYSQYLSVSDIFPVRGSGVKTDRDDLCFDFDKERLNLRMRTAFSGKLTSDFVEEFRIVDSSSYDLNRRLKTLSFDDKLIRRCLYRLFDQRWLYYHRGFTSRPAWDVMKHMLQPNLGLIVKRQARDGDYDWVFVTNCLMVDGLFSIDNKGREQLFPLRLQPDDEMLNISAAAEPNLSPFFLKAFALAFGVPQKGAHGLPAGMTPEDIFHYAYAVFHSPGYRSRYAEFLKIDFPRLPLTGNLELFRALARLGGELTALHLLESPKLNKPITVFVGGRNQVVEKPAWSDKSVWMDKAQTTGFQGVPEDVWNFHIGGYQVCHKWLKDRKGRNLTDDDIAHYSKVVTVLSETIRLMAEIDKVIDQQGGWPGAFQSPPKV